MQTTSFPGASHLFENMIAGLVRYWVTAGRGGFGLSTKECTEPGFYAICTNTNVLAERKMDRTIGYKACVSPVAPHGHPYATIKSNNYLRNALSLMDAESRGYDVVSVDVVCSFFIEWPA